MSPLLYRMHLEYVHGTMVGRTKDKRWQKWYPAVVTKLFTEHIYLIEMSEVGGKLD